MFAMSFRMTALFFGLVAYVAAECPTACHGHGAHPLRPTRARPRLQGRASEKTCGFLARSARVRVQRPATHASPRRGS